MNVQKRAVALRERLGLTQEQIAEAAGMAQGHYAKIESGKNKASTAGVRQGLARAVGVGLEAIGAYLDGDLSLDALLAARGSGTIATTARTTPTVEVDPEVMGQLDAELFRAMNPRHFASQDFDATRAAFREVAFLVREGTDLAAMARGWLIAARQLRQEGKPVNTTTIAARVATGRVLGSSPEDTDERLNADADEELQGAKKRARDRK
jgi:transcriptional regulator with XRE-family HTH domain